jgi:putative exosortase-associated protein (TIGR04073 family)
MQKNCATDNFPVALPELFTLVSPAFMKRLLSLALLSMLVMPALADIHDPPANDYGPTRKLGRGLANIVFGITELSVQPNTINEREGNAAAWSYGVVRGFGRYFARIGYGIYDVTTFPFASTRSSYRPPYKSNIPWIHGGMEEFPPELGFETRYRYTRSVYAYQ